MRFDLLQEPWLPVITLKGEAENVGLEDALNRAHEYRWLQGETPTVTAALHRLLLALVLRVHFDGLDVISSKERWSELWFRSSLPAERLERYLDGNEGSPGYRDRFDLFGTRPFFQSIGIPEKIAGSTAKLTMFRAAGNNATLFDHTTEDTKTALDPAEAARWLVTVQAFDTGGLKAGKRPSRPSLGNSFATVIIEGADLRETLLLNVPQVNEPEDPQSSSRDQPIWEREPTVFQESANTEKHSRAPFGQLDLLTWQSRHILLRGGKENTDLVVHDAAILPGPQPEIDLETIEHMAAFHRTFTTKKGARNKRPSSSWKPVQLEEIRGAWRNCRELLLTNESDDRQHECLRPRGLDRIAELPREEGHFSESTVYTLRLLGQQLDPNRGAVHTWLEETIPAPLSIIREKSYVTPMERLMEVSVSLADDMDDALQRMEHDYHALLRGTQKAERKLLHQWFWPHLAMHFNIHLRNLGERINEGIEGNLSTMESWAITVSQTALKAQQNWIDNLPRRTARNMFPLAKCSIQFKNRTRNILLDFNRKLSIPHPSKEFFTKTLNPLPVDIRQNRENFIAGLYDLGINLESGEATRAGRARSALARMRHSTGDPRYLPDVIDFVHQYSPEQSEMDVWIFVAILHSLNPRSASGGQRRPLGIAMRNCATRSSNEARLRQLLTSDWAVLQNRLRQVVRILQQEKIALDYGKLLDDLVELRQAPVGSARAHRVHLRWAEHFLSGLEDSEAMAFTS
ncbi:type I-E CRISPR-associated protein Cse1/CasA [Nocardiopsis alba]|uniref:Type I-E CRISPR-associated protein Cse1/CasA n=1 Tax=Nocardiopsis alba TaxID=53437 RepID=A0A7K2IRX0_9ACTN|nr:type I-E CRISPR-associated protein Cse1/CasA [Nocardiopsis alba]MYR32544.1 type I-E CRISPR-associated protein Cse1/CasA [Nocardiopsis alba]